ncbi:MucR family transcriptional regulator [Methylobacterium haplocladii]|uniref:MucR family transcriptional regulator n=1 Tax=Methylobacterium haplocladii TaxID=1176176 RepID=UPI0035715A82
MSNQIIRCNGFDCLCLRLQQLASTASIPQAETSVYVETSKPATIRKSITPDALISFIDGKPYKTWKRHLAAHGIDFETYRVRYGLRSITPSSQPITRRPGQPLRNNLVSVVTREGLGSD